MAQSVRSKAAKRDALLERLAEHFPDARCELYHESSFQLLIAVLLSAQTTDKMVNRCMQEVFREGFDVDTVLRLGEAGILGIIRPIGLAPTKAKNVYKLSLILKEQHDGKVPSTRTELEALPGVGRKTASVVLGEVFGHATLAVDTHVYRVTRRWGWHDEVSPQKAEPILQKWVPKRYLPAAHHWMILHGRYRCKARKPECSSCPLTDLCPSYSQMIP